MSAQQLPLAERLASQIQRQIAQGQFPPGARMPSLRDHARSSGVAKNTMVRIYELLVAEGNIEPRRGAGFFVTGRDPLRRPTEAWAPALDLALASVGIHRPRTGPAAEMLSLGEGLPPSAWLENCRLDRYMQKVARSGLGTVFRYGDPCGYLPLRLAISLKLQAYGITAEPKKIVLTQGAYQAVDILIRHLVRPGDAVLVDDPGFYPTFGKLRLQGARIHGVRRTPQGPDLDTLSALMRRHRPKLYFTQSGGHNPSAGDMTASVARAVVELAHAHGVMLVDDDALADFVPARTPRIGSVDQLARTIYVGSFSKSLSSVVRVGFLACDAELARQLTEVKTILCLNSSVYAERTVEAVITEGRFRKHVLALQARTRAATRSALAFLDARGVEVFTRPEQSLYLWARFPGVHDSADFARWIYGRGIALAPGAIFRPDNREASPWFRFNVGFIGPKSRFDEVLAASREWERSA